MTSHLYQNKCQMSNHNMADAALARREARRRKILENSHNRLQLISGKTSDEACKDSPVVTSPIPEYYDGLNVKESDTSSAYSTSNGLLIQESTSIDYSLSSRNLIEEASDLTSLISSTPDTSPSLTLLEKLALYKYDIVLISLLLQILYSLSLVNLDSFYMLLPLIVYTATKLFWYPSQNSFAIANALLLLNGLSASRVNKIMTATQLLTTFSQDICIFLFTTICTQALCLYVRNMT